MKSKLDLAGLTNDAASTATLQISAETARERRSEAHARLKEHQASAHTQDVPLEEE